MPVLGYIDAGSGSMIASAIVAGFAGIGVIFKMLGRRIFGLFSPRRRREAKAAAAAQKESEPASTG